MFSDFRQLLENFILQNNLEWEWKDEKHGTLKIMEFPLQIGYHEKNDIVFFKCGVGIPPSNPVERETLWVMLLSANNDFCGNAGTFLGYDAATDLITYQQAWPISGLTQENFDNLVQNALLGAAHWLDKLMPRNREVTSSYEDTSAMLKA